MKPWCIKTRDTVRVTLQVTISSRELAQGREVEIRSPTNLQLRECGLVILQRAFRYFLGESKTTSNLEGTGGFGPGDAPHILMKPHRTADSKVHAVKSTRPAGEGIGLCCRTNRTSCTMR